MTDLALIRLEALKLAHRPDQSPEMVIDRAKSYEEYILKESENRKRPGDGGKKPTAQASIVG
jgi:hypothetical protein